MKRPPCFLRVFRDAAFPLLVISLGACGGREIATVDHSPAAVGYAADARSDSATARPDDDVSVGAKSLNAAIDDLHQPRPGLYTAGQPAVAAWQAAAGAGVTTVINLRPPAELGDRDERAEVAAAGLSYFEIPVAGPGDINLTNARELARLIDEAPGPVLVHCASGNRVGALLALGEMEARDRSPERAVAFGRSAGLGSLEPRVREVIATMPAADCKADASC